MQSTAEGGMRLRKRQKKRSDRKKDWIGYQKNVEHGAVGKFIEVKWAAVDYYNCQVVDLGETESGGIKKKGRTHYDCHQYSRWASPDGSDQAAPRGSLDRRGAGRFKTAARGGGGRKKWARLLNGDCALNPSGTTSANKRGEKVQKRLRTEMWATGGAKRKTR